VQDTALHPHRLRTIFSEDSFQRLRDLLYHSPRDEGLDCGLWTLEYEAQVSFEQGIIPSPTSSFVTASTAGSLVAVSPALGRICLRCKV
jgi:hypothetical protein